MCLVSFITFPSFRIDSYCNDAHAEISPRITALENLISGIYSWKVPIFFRTYKNKSGSSKQIIQVA